MKIVTTDEMRRIERDADAGGLSYETMMENAGRAVAVAVEEQLDEIRDKQVLVLVGPGNNGGDGLVAGRYLHDAEAQVTIYIWKRNTENDENYRLIQERDIEVVFMEDDADFAVLRERVSRTDVIIDALLGTGVTRPIEGSLKEMLELINAEIRARRAIPLPTNALIAISQVDERSDHAPLIVAVDVSSGLNCDTGAVDEVSLSADVTVTFGFPKPGQFLFPGAAKVGKLLAADIAIPRELAKDVNLELITPDIARSFLPARPINAHKGTFGWAMVVAGSTNYTGAAYLAGAAATRVGAGLVTMGVSAPIYPIIAAKLTEATYLLLSHDMGALTSNAVKTIREKLPRYRALLVGPGLGQEDVTIEFVQQLLAMSEQPQHRPRVGFIAALEEESKTEMIESELPALVIDADGLNALAKVEEWWLHFPAPAILTPHAGEMSRLMDKPIDEINDNRVATARDAARKWGHVVVLKGAYTVIATPDGEIFISPFANAGLASAGTGDVLAGTIVGLLAQGVLPRDAAVSGVYLHGLSGELARNQHGAAGMVAGDLLPLLPKALKKLRGF